MEFIYEIENALPKEVCEELIEKFLKDNTKAPASIGGKIDPSMRKSTNIWINRNSNIWGDMTDKLVNFFIDGLNKYFNHLANSNTITNQQVNTFLNKELHVELPYVNKSKDGDYYHWHYDSNNESTPSHRLFSCLVYLNTLEEDQGGCTEFKCGKKVRPKQGKMLIFPASWTYEHRAAEVKNSGVKYTCGTWIG
jgi:hypothetical protein